MDDLQPVQSLPKKRHLLRLLFLSILGVVCIAALLGVMYWKDVFPFNLRNSIDVTIFGFGNNQEISTTLGLGETTCSFLQGVSPTSPVTTFDIQAQYGTIGPNECSDKNKFCVPGCVASLVQQ
ncbi:MAG: hypothetical protein WCV85_01745 [Patescibacteria group bacterium]|jgi:hypothetical protein